jgi:hypothetical protein
MATITFRFPKLCVNLICGFLANDCIGVPVLKDTVPGKHPVTNMGFQVCPVRSSVFSQASFTNA